MDSRFHNRKQTGLIYALMVVGVFSLTDIAKEHRHFTSYHYAQPLYTPIEEDSVKLLDARAGQSRAVTPPAPARELISRKENQIGNENNSDNGSLERK